MPQNMIDTLAILRFKIRPLLLIPIVILSRPKWPPYIKGLVLVIFGETLRLWAVGYLEKDEVLATAGPYQYCRHPSYLGNLIGTAGVIMMANRRIVGVLLLIYVLTTYPATLYAEDRHLRKLFKQEYETYSRQVPALIPRIGAIGAQPEMDAQPYKIEQVITSRETHVIAGLVLLASGIATKLIISASQRKKMKNDRPV